MLADFFQLAPIPVDQMLGTYDWRLVILSYLVAVFASFIALDFTGRLRDAGNTSASSLFWLIGGSIAMGAGIWSMHFIGMLSFSMPGMTSQYELFWTSLSLIVAILASGFALSLLKTKIINVTHMAIGGVILGIGIASMHYTGMEAMKIDMDIHYLPGIFFLSIVIAISASEAALWLALKSNQVVSRVRIRLKVISAVVMGVAICGMHYTGMVAAVFTAKNDVMTSTGSIDPTILAMCIAGITFVILGIAFFASTYKEALNQQQLEAARQLGMAEVAASVLHNVGNVLNSVNVSTNLVIEKMTHSKLEGLENLRELINKNKSNLGEFLTKDPNGIKIPEYLDKLAEYWHKEQSFIFTEVSALSKNVHHIKDIISMQQNLSKVTGFEHVVAIDELIDEALLITGLDSMSNDIVVEKRYGRFKPILMDKIKLLQILVNVIANAKDSLRMSPKKEKLLIIQASLVGNDKISIQFADNGIGVAPEILKKIFAYGFTTKKSGHGFGLHTCALAINEIGGSIHADSAGVEKGATFTLTMPYRLPRQ